MRKGKDQGAKEAIRLRTLLKIVATGLGVLPLMLTGAAGAQDKKAEQAEGQGNTSSAIESSENGAASTEEASADSKPQRLSPTVVTATRTETPVSELTRSVTVIDAEEIETQAALDRNLSDILGQTVPGMSPSTEALSNFGQTLRGRNFLVLVDGIPMSTPLRAASRDLNTIDPDMIERIEVVRGGTAAYGFGATGGMINLITRKPSEEPLAGHSQAGVRFSTEHPDDSLEWHTTHRASGSSKQFDYLVSGTFVERNSFFDADGERIPPDPLGVQGGFADSREWDGLAKLGYDFNNNRQRLELMINRFELFQDSDYTFGSGDPATRTKTPAVRGNINPRDPGTESTFVSLTYEHQDLAGSEVKWQNYYNDLTARFAKFPGFAQTEILSDKLGSRLTIDTPIQVSESYSLNAIWGVDYLRDETVQEGIDGPTVVPEMTQDSLAGFLEMEVPVGKIGKIRGGVRQEGTWLDVDDVVNRNGIFVRGGDLTFNETLFNATAVGYLTDNAEVFGGFSQGFSIADIGRAIRDGNATQAEALEEEAQKVDNYELGLRGNWDWIEGSVAGFYSESEKGTTFSPNLQLSKQPERIWGVETTLDVHPHEQWTVGMTFTWQEGEVDLNDDDDFEEDLPSTRIPPVKVTPYVEYEPFDWWTSRLQLMYSGGREPDSSQFGGGEVDGYAIVDLYNSFDVGPGSLRVGIENLFNEDYFPVVNQASAAPWSFSKGPGRMLTMAYALPW